jgi:hypothetical protein
VQGHGWKLYFRVRPHVGGQVGNLLSIGCCTTSLLVRSFVVSLKHNKLRHGSVTETRECDDLYGWHLKLEQKLSSVRPKISMVHPKGNNATVKY